MKTHLGGKVGYGLFLNPFYLEDYRIVGIWAADSAGALLFLPGDVSSKSQSCYKGEHGVKSPVAEVLRREVLEYELIPCLQVEMAFSTPFYLDHLDFNFDILAQVFLSFFLAAGNRILFKIKR